MDIINTHPIPHTPNLLRYTPGDPGPLALDVSEWVDLLRLNACRQLEQSQRGEMGQYFTPAPVARLMAGMLDLVTPHVSILDAGAGIGSLFAACVADLCHRDKRPTSIHVTAYEIEEVLLSYLNETVAMCSTACERAGIKFTAEIRPVDFLQEASELLTGNIFLSPLPPFTAAILNPPYRKINTKSETREHLRQIGIETSNLYTGFLAVATRLLAPEGELVAITPRSFCNGTYFRSFREAFLRDMALQRIHLFDSREDAFRDDAVLQETIIIHALKTKHSPERVCVTTSASADDDFALSRDLPYEEVVHPGDPERFIRVVSDETGQQIVSRMARFQATLGDLGLTVSTGRVVDFRANEYLRERPDPGDTPLLYPVNLENGATVWPRPGRKPQALTTCKETESLLVPNEHYTLVKRFTSKEQTRRVISAVFEGGKLPGAGIGFENHLNYFHKQGRGLDLRIAKGLSVFLNSTLVDEFFRQFNGHTQVNAGDLRSLKYPTLDQLAALGGKIGADYPAQAEIDNIIEQEFFSMADTSSGDPIANKKRVEEALEVLGALGMPKAQLNERSALTLLALLDLAPALSWQEATNPLRGITPMMEFMDQQYGKKYAPNSRETVRRQSVHQFLDAGLIIANPDAPQRPTNSGKSVYQIEASALELLRTYGMEEWTHSLKAYLASVETLKTRYAQERAMARIPIEIAPGQTITLSPGGQNVLVEQIITEFAPRFTPGAQLIYVGDTDEKFAHFNKDALTALGVEMDAHGKMPDVIIHYTAKNWLVLIEAVTSHGPIDPKRKTELETLFKGSSAGLVLVTTFLSRKAMVEYLPAISWETEVWVADTPSHMIHFNGERFLGPY
jgi:adenine-specific DNA-methyltransferase